MRWLTSRIGHVRGGGLADPGGRGMVRRSGYRRNQGGGYPMQVVDLDHQPKEEWRPGVITQMHVSAQNGATQLCVFEQWCEPGHGAPTHLHAVEEILHVFEGQAEVWIGETRMTLTPGQLVV